MRILRQGLIMVGLLASIAIPLSGASAPIRIEVAKDAKGQLALSRAALQKAYATPRADTFASQQAIAHAIGELEMVPRLWPEQRNEVAEAYVMEADLMQFAQLDLNAVETLQRGVTNIGDTKRGALLYSLLGHSLHAVHRDAEAEQSFARAEQHPLFGSLDTADKERILLSVALFYEQQKRPLEASSRYLAAASLKGVPDLHAASHLLRAADTASQADPERARAILATLDSSMEPIRRRNLTDPAEIELRKTLEAGIAHLKKKLA